MCGVMAQLIEHRTGIAEVTGSNPVEALIFSGFFFPIAYIGKFTAKIVLHFVVIFCWPVWGPARGVTAQLIFIAYKFIMKGDYTADVYFNNRC